MRRLSFAGCVGLIVVVSCSSSPFGVVCKSDADCGAGVRCLPFCAYTANTGKPGNGPVCTIECKTDADCEKRAPGTKCWGSYPDQGCGGIAVCYKHDTPLRPGTVCVYATAKCFPDICTGCTAGGYGKCPPRDTDYSEVCSETDEAGCRGQVAAPQQVSPSSSLQRWTRDVRLLRGVASCADYRSGGDAAATSIDRYCSGPCM